jgi:hypothetical protein
MLHAAHIRVKTQNQLLPILTLKKLEITAPVGKKPEGGRPSIHVHTSFQQKFVLITSPLISISSFFFFLYNSREVSHIYRVHSI